MFREEKNLKDSTENTSPVPAPYRAVGFGTVSYIKTNKLITALYMVTDIIDKDEPIRNKLRTLGTGIISDMNSTPLNICNRISEIMSFLEIASAVNIISEMNYAILKKEFSELNQSILSLDTEKESSNRNINKQINLSEFFREPIRNTFSTADTVGELPKTSVSNSIGHQHPTRIGVQKGSTLMKALSDKINPPTDIGRLDSRRPMSVPSFDILKKQRRDEIISIIKTIGGNATIKDIKDKAQALPTKAGSLVSCSEKTLQRELVSMVKDGVLNKTGDKRWSRYELVSRD